TELRRRARTSVAAVPRPLWRVKSPNGTRRAVVAMRGRYALAASDLAMSALFSQARLLRRGASVLLDAGPGAMSIHPSVLRGFGAAAESYERARPDYPSEAVNWLAE